MAPELGFQLGRLLDRKDWFGDRRFWVSYREALTVFARHARHHIRPGLNQKTEIMRACNRHHFTAGDFAPCG